MGTPTVNPTPEQVWSALPLVDQDVAAVMDELVLRLEQGLPGCIDDYNTRKGLTGNRKVKKPESYGIAPTTFTDAFINTVAIAVDITTENPHPGRFFNTIQLVVYSLDERIEAKQQVRNAFHRARIIRGYLLFFLRGLCDAEGTQLYKQLIPTGVSLLPASMGDYSGAAIYYALEQTPNNSRIGV